MLGADLWLTGLSGAQSVGHSTNLRDPCPCWLLGNDWLTDWPVYSLADWWVDWLTDWPTLCHYAALHIIYLELYCALHSPSHKETWCRNPRFMKSLSVVQHFTTVPTPFSHFVSQWLAETAHYFFLGMQCWNELIGILCVIIFGSAA